MCTLLPWIPPGGAAISAAPTKQAVKKLPRNAPNTQNLLQRKTFPLMTRMFTDVGGYGIPAIPTLTNSVDSVNSVGEKIFPQNARNAQKLLAEKTLPQMSTELTEPLAEKSLPQTARMFTDVGGYGIPAIPTLPNSVYSVNSVGEQRTLSICVNL